jgi:hypothetical protein
LKDDDTNKFTPPLAIDAEFSHRAFANPCMMETKGAAGATIGN